MTDSDEGDSRPSIPKEEGELVLLVGVDEAVEGSLDETVESLGGRIESELGFGYSRVVLNRDMVENLSNKRIVSSVETEGRGKILNEGNFRSLCGSALRGN
jgi:hypothetical protein